MGTIRNAMLPGVAKKMKRSPMNFIGTAIGVGYNEPTRNRKRSNPTANLGIMGAGVSSGTNPNELGIEGRTGDALGSISGVIGTGNIDI